MLVPHDNERVRSFQVSAKGVRAVISLGLIVILVMTTFSVGFFVKQGQQIRAASLARENELLAAEVDEMRSQMAELNRNIDHLAEKDEKYRVMAGLNELDDDVRAAGIGGPESKSVGAQALMQLDRQTAAKVRDAASDLSGLLRRAVLLRSSMDESLVALERNRDRLASMPSIAPSNGHLSSLFSPNRRHPVLRITRPHKGIDIAARVGEPIVAPAKGRVRFSGSKANGYGYMVEIDHGHGYVTRFAHASRLLVRTGAEVKRGQVIAEVGATGLVSGPHLHYEVEVNGQQVDPLHYIIGDAIPD